MTMNEIADVAEVSVGSIYQYFSNKGAVIVALAEQLLEINLKANEAVLSNQPRSLVHLSHLMMELLDRYYDLHRSDPVMADIWTAYRADKALVDADHEDDLRNRDLVFAVSRHLFPDNAHERAKQNLLLLIKLGSAAVQYAAQLDDKQGREVISETKAILYAAWEVSILPLARFGDQAHLASAELSPGSKAN